MTKAPTKKPPTDWEAIEREFRAGQLSLRQIGALHGVTEGAIRKRAKNEGWQRDLTDRVRQSVRQGLLRHDADGTQASTQASTQTGTRSDPVARPPRRHTEAEDRAIVDSAAARGVDIVLRHRADASRLRTILDRVLVDVELSLGIREMEPGKEKPVPAKSAAETLDRATKITMQIIGIERQAFNLDEPEAGGDDGDPIAALRNQLQGTAFKPTSFAPAGGDADG